MKYLALGDSYTIGEQVEPEQSFPHQVVNRMKDAPKPIERVHIVAKTGWKTYDLIREMEAQVHEEYDYVTLLIGVNNQYNNRTEREYKIHFQYILNRAISYAGGKVHRVYVLSIPDWGRTPFNADRDPATISKEIDSYNKIAREECMANGVVFIDITESTRKNASDPSFLAADRLHVSEKEYAIWADLVAHKMRLNAFCAVVE